MKQNLLLMLFVGVTVFANSQVVKTLDSLERVEQNCLDKGIKMSTCTWVYYTQIDSLLNIEYARFKNQLTADKAKTTLQSEQLKWLSSRDLYFQKLEKRFMSNRKSGEWGKDAIMFVWQEKAAYVKKRVLAIAAKLTL